MRRANASGLLVLAALVAAVVLAGCGAGFPVGTGSDGGGDDDSPDAASIPSDASDVPDAEYQPDGPPPPTDGGDGTDATPACFTIVITAPTEPAPTEVQARAEGEGFLGAPTWRVTGPLGENVPFSYDDARHIHFTSGVHGVFEVTTSQACATQTVELASSPREYVTFYLRYTPRPAEGVPPQEDPNGIEVVTETAELSFLDPPHWLTRAHPVHATISGEVGVLGAQVTFVPDGPVGWPVSLYADLQRVVSGPVLDVAQTLVIVPGDGTLAPYTLRRAPQELDLTSIPFARGTRLTGTIVDAHDLPVADTWISVGADRLPPALVKTDADGSFALDVRSGNLRFEVAPAAGSGKAALVAEPDLQVRVQGGPVRIALADASPTTLTGWQVKSSEGAFLGGAHVTFVAQVGAGTITQGGVTKVVPATETRVRVDTDAAGKLPDVTLPAARYDVVVEPPVATSTDVLSVTSLDLRAATTPAPGTFTTVAPVGFALELVDADGVALSHARVTAVAQGRFGVQKGAALHAQADDVGNVFAMSGPPGMVYDLVVDGPQDSTTLRARARVRVDSATLLPMVPLRVKLPPVTIVHSRLLKADHTHGAAGVTVSVHCGGIGCPDPDFVYAETTTSADLSTTSSIAESGTFSLAVPDLPRVTP
jgi:hypothetical protein